MSVITKIQSYFKESYVELKKVTWPTRRQTINDSLLVIAISVAVGLFLGALDYVYNIGLGIFIASFTK